MRPEKKSIVDEMRSRLADSVFVILADYQGLSVTKTQEHRRRLGTAHAKIHVVKNRLFRHASAELGFKELGEKMSGPSAMVFGKGDVVQAAKILKDFIKENERPVIKIGSLQGVILTAADVAALASLPSREVLLARALGSLVAPMRQLVGVLNQKVASLVYVLSAVAEKKSKSEAASNA